MELMRVQLTEMITWQTLGWSNIAEATVSARVSETVMINITGEQILHT